SRRPAGSAWTLALAAALWSLALSAVSVTAAGSFLTLMSTEEARATGVDGLSTDQRYALEAWIAGIVGAAMRASGGGETYASKGDGHWVSESALDGRVVALEDESLWEIAPTDRVNTILWLPTTSVTVVKSPHAWGLYRYLLVNTEDNENVSARYLGSN